MENKRFTEEFRVRKCITCNGEGTILIDSHDCWGKPEWYERCCSVCGGNGFILPPELISEIKKELGITPTIKFGRGE